MEENCNEACVAGRGGGVGEMRGTVQGLVAFGEDAAFSPSETGAVEREVPWRRCPQTLLWEGKASSGVRAEAGEAGWRKQQRVSHVDSDGSVLSLGHTAGPLRT
jgi:hypothetical protein